MKKVFDWRRSIYLEMTLLLLISALAAVLFFMITNFAVEAGLSSFIERLDFNRRRSDIYAAELQGYIDEVNISSENLELIEYWKRRNSIVIMLILDEGKLIYDSEYGIESDVSYVSPNSDVMRWGNTYTLSLADKDVELYIYGSFDYALYRSVEITELIFTFIIFFVLFFYGMSKRIRYIQQLESEIDILEGGSLDYEISVKGKDELAKLAKALNSMRLSFINQKNETEKLALTNQTMITQMSHDLRTPLTAVLLYAEILENGKQRLSDEQKQEYIDKIVRKIEHMKELSDKLLSYSTELKPRESVALETLKVKSALYDELSELCGYLDEQGFTLDADIRWQDCSIAVNDEFVSRILNNISSNILKYADKSCPIVIRCAEDANELKLSFGNHVGNISASDSKKIGVNSIKSMMQRMNGSCRVKNDEKIYCIELFFPIIEE